MHIVFVSGGVLSGLGKGITTASLSLLLKYRGYKVSCVKCDMYLNIDAGTMNPTEHGEVFVTEDGLETDQDLGHYERFLNQDHTKNHYITAGQVYWDILKRERSLAFGGECVEAYKHVPEEIIQRLRKAAKGKDILVVEFGGTVGEYQNIMFFEAVRRLKMRQPEKTVLVHVGYLPTPGNLGEMKSKPLQQSIHELHRLGLNPDFIIARAEKPIDAKRKRKIAFIAGLTEEDVISNPNVLSVYEIPLILEGQSFSKKVLKKLDLRAGKQNLTEWNKLVKKTSGNLKPIRIAIVAKYIASGNFTLEDSYICVNEALKHAAWKLGAKPELVWIDSERLESANTEELNKLFTNASGMIVPQGWGSRGVEGKIKAIKYARENKIPYLGLCFGMQMAVTEFARHVCGLKGANSQEVVGADPRVRPLKHPVIHIMPGQQEYLTKNQYGGTIRLGSWPCKLKAGSLLHTAYSNNEPSAISHNPLAINERHRHRYEVNNEYRDILEKNGMIISGTSPDGKLVEAIELDQKLHPFFVGTQFHPELKSRPLSPHPIFVEFIRRVLEIRH